jgi:hypothetical protein
MVDVIGRGQDLLYANNLYFDLEAGYPSVFSK